MSARWGLALLLGGIALQWAVPGYLIHRGQITLEQGAVYRFRTAPVDPVDPFRGRYVTLDFAAARVPVEGAANRYRRGQRVYAAIVVDDGGDAHLTVPQDTPPATGDYLEAHVQWANEDEIVLQLPFDRYYLDEHLAPEAERLYRDRNRPTAQGEDPRRPAYVQVRVRKGYALIEELYIDGAPVRERLRH